MTLDPVKLTVLTIVIVTIYQGEEDRADHIIVEGSQEDPGRIQGKIQPIRTLPRDILPFTFSNNVVKYHLPRD